MVICFNCGNEMPDDSGVCGNCGNSLSTTSSAAPSREQAPPKPPRAAPPPPQQQAPLVGMGYSPSNAKAAVDKAKGRPDTKSKDEEAAKRKVARAAMPKMPAPPVEDDETGRSAVIGIRNILDREKRKARALAIAGVMLLAASMMLPWFYFFEGRPVEAFRVPVLFLYTGSNQAAAVTAGLVLCVLFAVSFFSAVFDRSIITFAQIAAFVALLMGVGGFLTVARMWNAMEGLGGRYSSFAYEQQLAIDGAGFRVFAPVETAPVNMSETPVGSGAATGWSFMSKVAGPGLFLALLSSFLVLFATVKYSPFFRFFNLSVPVTLSAIVTVAFLFLFSLFVISRVAPAWWYNRMASIFVQMGNTPAAIEKLNQCSELPIKSGTCEVALAGLYLDAGNRDEARELMLRASREIPFYPDVRKTLGDIYFSEKNFDGAAEQFRKYLEQKPGDAAYKKRLSDSIIMLANAKYAARNFKAALNGFREAESLLFENKSNIPMQYKMADSCYQLGMKQDSIAHYKTIADIQRTDFEAQIQVAKVYEETGDFDNALAYYKKSIDAKEDNSFAYVYIGDMYLNMKKDKVTAIEWYNKAIEANLYNKGADAARERLEKLGASVPE